MNIDEISRYEFFAVLKQHHAFKDYMKAFALNKPGQDLFTWMQDTEPYNWLGSAFNWSRYDIRGSNDSWTNSYSWNRVNDIWTDKIEELTKRS